MYDKCDDFIVPLFIVHVTAIFTKYIDFLEVSNNGHSVVFHDCVTLLELICLD